LVCKPPENQRFKIGHIIFGSKVDPLSANLSNAGEKKFRWIISTNLLITIRFRSKVDFLICKPPENQHIKVEKCAFPNFHF